jgi:hypothetical protein
VGKEAAKRGIKVFVELSTGMVYKPDSQVRVLGFLSSNSRMLEEQ